LDEQESSHEAELFGLEQRPDGRDRRRCPGDTSLQFGAAARRPAGRRRKQSTLRRWRRQLGRRQLGRRQFGRRLEVGRTIGSSTPRGAHRIPPGDSGSSRGGGDRTARDGSPSGDTGNATAGAPSSTPTDPAPGESRPRNGQPRTGTAVARRSVPPASGGGTTIFVPGGYYGNYYPWGYGGFGLGGYYGGYSDPWYYGGPYQGYSYRDGYDGQLRLKVKPRVAQVFVDGYFAGIVDDFDGVFQRLHIEPGPHRIEIRDDGYEPLSFEVRILPDRTVTYSGDLKRLTP